MLRPLPENMQYFPPQYSAITESHVYLINASLRNKKMMAFSVEKKCKGCKLQGEKRKSQALKLDLFIYLFLPLHLLLMKENLSNLLFRSDQLHLQVQWQQGNVRCKYNTRHRFASINTQSAGKRR